MSKQTDFIDKIAPLIQKHAPKYGILCPSAVIAQACLESGYGASRLSAQYHNYFGLKCGTAWTGKSVNMTTSEEYSKGTYTIIKDNFRVYDSMEEGVIGYFEFIQLSRYHNLRGISDPEKYLQTIKADGYATSSTYVRNTMSVVEQYDLTKYDKGVKKTAIDFNKYIYSTGTHYISNSGSDENGRYHGGKAGDQTGKEWRLRSWYDRPWNCVLRHPDPAVAYDIAKLGIAAALNDHIGYDQYQRQTYWTLLQKAKYKPSKITENCEADCSAGVIANVRAVGYRKDIDKLKNINATYTGNMRSGFKAAGFKVLTASRYTKGPEYLLPGDILLNDSAHTATNITIGNKVKFVIEDKPAKEEKPTINVLDYVMALQTALNVSYRLKLVVNGQFNTQTKNAIDAHYLSYIPGNVIKNSHVSWLQETLNIVNDSGLEVDGSFGPASRRAVLDFQKKYGLMVDGYAGVQTHKKIIVLMKG